MRTRRLLSSTLTITPRPIGTTTDSLVHSKRTLHMKRPLVLPEFRLLHMEPTTFSRLPPPRATKGPLLYIDHPTTSSGENGIASLCLHMCQLEYQTLRWSATGKFS